MTTTQASANTSERRESYRITQDSLFDYKLVDSFTAENETASSQFEDSDSSNLVNELRRLDKDSVQTLRLLTDKNRLLGDYLQTLSKKIDLIARHSLFASEGADSTGANARRKRLNLSEDGIAFLCDRTLYKGNFIAVKLVFLPLYTPIVAFARVVRCEQKGDEYRVAAKFFRISDKDRQEVAKQVLKAQVKNKRRLQPNTE